MENRKVLARPGEMRKHVDRVNGPRLTRVVAAAAAALALGAPAALALAGPAHADSDDVEYVTVLDKLHIHYESPQIAAQAGRELCTGLDNGLTWSTLVNAGTKAGYSGYQAGEIVGAAVGIYCPEYGSTIQAEEQQAITDAINGAGG
jgi:hypothetical protein